MEMFPDPREPVRELGEFDLLDREEMAEGYRDGRSGEFAPGDNRSRSYWHGWRNGQVDGGHAKPSADQSTLAAKFYARQRGQDAARNAEKLFPLRLPPARLP